MPKNFHGCLEGRTTVCIACGATPETNPEHVFVPFGRYETCEVCIGKAAAELKRNTRRIDSKSLVRTLIKETLKGKS